MPQLSSNPIFSLLYVKNTGAAFSIFEGARMFLIIFAILALTSVIFYTIKNITKYSLITVFCSAMLCAGIFCNMCERIILGYVRDFIKLNFIDFPVFNISDIYINISVFVIVFIVIKNTYFRKHETDN